MTEAFKGEHRMASLAVATTLPELKQLYRRYASKFHPDKGGCHERMSILNKQYRIMKQRIKQAANDPSHSQYNPPTSFGQLKVGDRLYVNNTRCEVVNTNSRYFRVVAIGRSRQAQFDIETGTGRFNPRLKASFYLVIGRG